MARTTVEVAVCSLLVLSCGARSALLDGDGDVDGTGGVSATLAVGATSSGGIGCAPQLLGVDGDGAVRLELDGDTVVYSTVTGQLVRADLAQAPPQETILARALRPGGDVALYAGYVYYVAQDDFDVVVKRVPIAGGLEEDVFYPDANPAWIEVDASGVYVADSELFTGRVVRILPDGTVKVLANQLGQSYPIAIAGEAVFGFAWTLPGVSSVNNLYVVAKTGGPPSLLAPERFGVAYAGMIDGVLRWYQPSSTTPGHSDLYTYDPSIGVVSSGRALPDSALTFGSDGDRIYVTAIAEQGARSNVIYATDRSGAVVGTFSDGEPTRFPTEIRAAGGRVMWTVQRRTGIEDDVPSVQIECIGAFH